MANDLKPGDQVKGVFSGIYLGRVISVIGRMAILRTPNGLADQYPADWLEPVPEIETETGRARVWVM